MSFRARHLLGIEHLAPDEITTLIDLADTYATDNRAGQNPPRRAGRHDPDQHVLRKLHPHPSQL